VCGERERERDDPTTLLCLQRRQQRGFPEHLKCGLHACMCVCEGVYVCLSGFPRISNVISICVCMCMYGCGFVCGFACGFEREREIIFAILFNHPCHQQSWSPEHFNYGVHRCV